MPFIKSDDVDAEKQLAVYRYNANAGTWESINLLVYKKDDDMWVKIEPSIYSSE